ncbi:MAG: single-stranded DNA-binding protein [Butyrivibrio sp.]|uniref:single-stranded DNA-binding protein n=1 Tax=Butyrivibrio sp. TaxID=28121 RepID=UPI001B65CC7D|nr:single-stranded DNA-binding protein [Butyrivibrio sp.]MBP3278168.1 single-stranded DNA-binding protein [Butyrivibrio sp.]MBP3782099.1 single-stranded DNA-binding protein [Butyrivibrio sp.]
MGRQNIAFLYARVHKPPQINKDVETGEYLFGTVYLDTVRGLREVEDDLKYVKHEFPLVVSREKEQLDKMAEWKENDIVLVKGVITSKAIMKASYCPHCTDENGNHWKNEVKSNLVYITPIFVEKLKSYGEDKTAAREDLVDHREISNQLYVMGRVLKDPKLFTTKKNVQITQYPIALNRKFTIRTDDPSIRTDWPIVKSYGERARDDKLYLQYESDVLIDGFVQARTVTRKMICPHCGKLYEWKDNSMEVAAYDVEYVNGYKSKEQVEAEAQGKSVEELKQMLFETGYKDELEENLQSSDTV